MTSTRGAINRTSAARYDIDGLLAAIEGVPTVTDPVAVRRRSRDFFWYSPILNQQLAAKSADILVAPRDETDVVRVVAACARLRIPLTVRAGGTGNYGQAVPLEGGVLLDINSLNAVEWHKPGITRVQAGAKMHDQDLVRLRRLERRVIELRGDAAQKINRAYGTTGIITALEMPLAPAWPWIDLIITFDDFFEAMRFGYDVALADGVIKKLLTPMIWPIPANFPALKAHIPDGKSVVFAMIAQPSLETFKSILGTITYEVAHDDSPNVVPLYEYTWNHTTLHWLKQDRTITYLQCLFPHERVIESVREMWAMFPDEVLPHTEFIRFGGRVTCSALPIVRYRNPERLNEIIALHEQHGVMIANPHVFTLEDGSRHKRADADQAGYKAEVDPYGLLNPGKMRSYVPVRT